MDLDIDHSKVNEKSLDCEIRETFETGSCTGDSIIDSDSCLTTEVKSQPNKTINPEYNDSPTKSP